MGVFRSLLSEEEEEEGLYPIPDPPDSEVRTK